MCEKSVCKRERKIKREGGREAVSECVRKVCAKEREKEGMRETVSECVRKVCAKERDIYI